MKRLLAGPYYKPGKWYKWFAWRSIMIETSGLNNTYYREEVWLETVERRRISKQAGDTYIWAWEYRSKP